MMIPFPTIFLGGMNEGFFSTSHMMTSIFVIISVATMRERSRKGGSRVDGVHFGVDTPVRRFLLTALNAG